jgi:polysaccharide biosynthesis transport protein
MLHRTPRSRLSLERDAGLPPEPDYVSFTDISRFFQRNVLIIVVCFVCAAAIGIGIVYHAEPKYTARAQILIDPSTNQLVRDASASPERSLDTAQVEGQVALLRSESLAYYVIGTLKLTEDPEFQGGPQSYTQRLIGEIQNLLGSGGEPGEAMKEVKDDTDYARLRSALEVFLGGLDVRRVGMSYAIDISYTSVDPNKAAKIANAVAEAYIQDQLKAVSRAAQKSSEWLEDRLTQIRKQLNASARQLEMFKTGRAPGQQSDVQASDKPAPSPQPGTSDVAGANGQPAAGQARDTALPRGQLTLAELESTTESYRKTYEAYQQAFTEAVQRQSFPISNARVITAATRPLSKSAPRGRLIVMLTSLAGVLIGVALAFLRQSMDPTVRSARQLQAKTGLACLALMPRVGTGRRGLLRWSLSPAQPDYNFRVAIDAPFSPFSNALKTLRTAIAHADPRRPVRVVGLTSGMPREGKSMVAGNLATLYTLSAGRTLLIDADIHNSTASRYFAPRVKVGLLEVVSGAVELDKAIVKGSGFVPDILPIAVKEAAPVSYEQLASEKMAALLHTLREQYDMIIVDLPPVNPIIDGVAIAALLDGVVIVAEWGRAPVELLAEVAATLHTAQANVLGVVITKADRSAATIRWRKDWGYGYYPLGDGSPPVGSRK